jgi:DNA-binding NtrC family response regulator
LPPTLIQSELFGHEKGAFTGAERRKIGSIEAANGGTLFLDEIGDLSLPLQVNLLRFLEGSTIQRVGSPKEIRVDVRVIAATHTDMEQATARDAFREDLYFRLNVLRLEMPALRMRGEDIEVLAQFFFKQFARESAHRVKGFSPEALRSLVEYDWPGNVRELINRVRRATVMCDGRLIRSADLGFDGRPRAVRIPTLEEVRAVAERDAILTALRGTGNNMSQAARALGTSRPRLYRLMARYDLQV